MSDKPEATRLADALGSHYAHLTEVPRINREAAAELRRLHGENESLKRTLAASCDEEQDQLWEAGPGGGCSRARSAEAVNRELLKALKHAHTWLQGSEPGRAQYLGEVIAKAEKT